MSSPVVEAMIRLLGAFLVLAVPACADGNERIGLFWGRHPDVLYGIETREPVVALTIDDGPDPENTRALLDLLARHDAHATFFLITSRIPGNEALVEEIVAAGHELGNHMVRDRKSVDLAPEEFEREFLRARTSLERFAPIRWFRPGSGWYDDWMVEIVSGHGQQLVLGTVYPLDAQLHWSWLAARFILWRAEPGSIVILHESRGRGRRTIRTLERVLPELARRGQRAVTLSELVASTSAPSDAGASGAHTDPR
jgi:peptidoglycan/xylan/chitin deacetylase (PgdA/CDA1 family)